jgi:hypothetical protein
MAASQLIVISRGPSVAACSTAVAKLDGPIDRPVHCQDSAADAGISIAIYRAECDAAAASAARSEPRPKFAVGLSVARVNAISRAFHGLRQIPKRTI